VDEHHYCLRVAVKVPHGINKGILPQALKLRGLQVVRSRTRRSWGFVRFLDSIQSVPRSPCLGACLHEGRQV